MAKGQGQYYTTIIDEFKRIELRQGIAASASSNNIGKLLGAVVAIVGTSTTQNIFDPPSTTSLATISDAATDWTIAAIPTYRVEVELVGTGTLVLGQDYSITGSNTIHRLNGQVFTTGEKYIVRFYGK